MPLQASGFSKIAQLPEESPICGRYSIALEPIELAEVLECDLPDFVFVRRYNVAPTQDVPVVVMEDGKRRLRLMRWGLVPSWAKDPAIGNKMINARAETVAEKPSYRKPFQRQRCLAPATSFFEWQKVTGARAKIPMCIAFKGMKLFAMAGLWDLWKMPDGRELRSFAIITTAAGDFMRPIHERQPVISDRKDWQAWLDPALTDPARLTALLASSTAAEPEAYEVSTAVNSPSNDVEECIRSVAKPATL